MTFILASASPRRRALLEMLRVAPLRVIPAAAAETAPPGLPPEELARRLAEQKAREVRAAHAGPGDIVIGADTLVALSGDALGKPKDAEAAEKTLARLSGNTHQVYTGLCVLRDGAELSHTERTEVRFRSLSPAEIRRYVATGEPMDKAGAYGIQGLGSLFVERLEGDYYNVMGLPLCALGVLLRQMGVELG